MCTTSAFLFSLLPAYSPAPQNISGDYLIDFYLNTFITIRVGMCSEILVIVIKLFMYSFVSFVNYDDFLY